MFQRKSFVQGVDTNTKKLLGLFRAVVCIVDTLLLIRRCQDIEHILSLSYGKDSLACLGAIEQLGWPLDRVVTAEVWATDTIPADLPPMVEFKAKADRIIKERWGIEVEHVCRMSSGQKITYNLFFIE